MTPGTPDKEFSRPVRVEPLPRNGLEQTVEASEAERKALAELNGLPAIAALKANFRIAKWRRGVRVEGELTARVTQTCVVSLEPFEVDIDEPIDVRFLPANPDRPPPAETDEESPDEIVDGRIDLGALASEFLTLALDPYPRKPGAALAVPATGEEKVSPFARLRTLSDREEPD